MAQQRLCIVFKVVLHAEVTISEVLSLRTERCWARGSLAHLAQNYAKSELV